MFAHTLKRNIVVIRKVKFSSSPKAVIEQCQSLRSSIQDLNDKFKGNHSSGKSSFVNYVIQRKVQAAGVAPTDDCFTVIAPGPSDVDRDGPAFVGDPDMGFAGLRSFGPTLVHHTNLKIRSNTAVQDFMIVDSPDNKYGKSFDSQLNRFVMDRGYDFEKVCRWYADRADVILLFFDPDKPGTTGETLTVLTNSLAGLEHKLHIILNKADQFEKIHDFARAYGSLCWNLSKVIHRKDLPRIYTMCLPSNLTQQQSSSEESHSKSKFNLDDTQHKYTHKLGQKSMIDLDNTREEVVQEVLNAPKRRVNNEISRLSDAVHFLSMHVNITEEIVSQYKSQRFKLGGLSALISCAAAGVPIGEWVFLSSQLPTSVIAASGFIGALCSGGSWWYTTHSLKDLARKLVTEEELTGIYKRLYAHQIAQENSDVESLWIRTLEHLKIGLNASDVANLSKPGKSEKATIQNILESEIPQLRRKISPSITNENM